MMISRSARAQAPARRAEWSHRIASAGVAAGERVGAPEQRREAELAVHGRDVARGDGGVEADGSDVEGAIAVAAPDLEGGEGAGAGVGAGEAGLGDADDGAAARVVEALAEAGVVRSEPDVRVDDDELERGHPLEHLEEVGQLALVEGAGLVGGGAAGGADDDLD